MKKFQDFLMFKEGSAADKGISSEVKLSDDSDYKPFVVDTEHHSNLRTLVKAFSDSGNVFLPGPDGFPSKMTTVDAKGENSPKLKKKNLYLVGGAVRDHLHGKTPKDYDLATDATPDEIRLILRNAGFTEVKPQTGKHAPKDQKYEKHPDAGSKNKIYYAKGWDRAGKEFVIGAKVNGEEFEIATFRKDSKGSDGRTPDKMEFTPSFDEDSARRDFTINSMAIPLTNSDGANNKLLDPHGGAHHLKSGDVRFVGNAKERLQEDQLRALRYIRFASRFGANSKIPEEYKQAIQEIKDLPSVSKERVRDEFVKGLEHPEVDTLKYMKTYKELGLLSTVFPGMKFNLETNQDYSDKKDKRLQVAWILKDNSPEEIKDMLGKGTWTNNEITDILHLIKLQKWGGNYGKDNDEFFRNFYDVKSAHQRTALVPSVVKQWGQMTGMNDDMIKHYLQHNFDTKGYVDDSFGNKTVNPLLTQLLGKTPEGKEFGVGIKHIETENFKKRFQPKEDD